MDKKKLVVYSYYRLLLSNENNKLPIHTTTTWMGLKKYTWGKKIARNKYMNSKNGLN